MESMVLYLFLCSLHYITTLQSDIPVSVLGLNIYIVRIISIVFVVEMESQLSAVCVEVDVHGDHFVVFFTSDAADIDETVFRANKLAYGFAVRIYSPFFAAFMPVFDFGRYVFGGVAHRNHKPHPMVRVVEFGNIGYNS